MRISSLQARTQTDKAKRRTRRPSGTGGFSQSLSEAQASAARPSAHSVPADSVSAILAVQEVPSATDAPARRRAIARGEAILAQLDALRADILAGTVSADRLAAIAGEARARRETLGDSRLDGILGEIELRAEVELAKLQRRA